MKVAVVTPTIASEHLSKCIDSVDKQTHKDIVHYIFIDGCQYESKTKEILVGASNTKIIQLEENIGKGWYGHRVYAACSFLVNADVICYLDEDNFFDPNHIELVIKKLQEGNDWVYSLRKVVDKDGKFLCEDNCESLGKWPVYFNPEISHIDTSCFAVRRDVAVRIGHSWYGRWGADRIFFSAIKNNFPKYDCTNNHTVNYRLDGNPNSVSQDFFDEGNVMMYKKYGTDFPWKKMNKTGSKTYTERIKIAPGITLVN